MTIYASMCNLTMLCNECTLYVEKQRHSMKPIKIKKHRLTAFVDPVLVTRARVRGALDGLTISEVVEKALDAYAPFIEKNSDNRLNITFHPTPGIGKKTVASDARSHRKATTSIKPVRNLR